MWMFIFLYAQLHIDEEGWLRLHQFWRHYSWHLSQVNDLEIPGALNVAPLHEEHVNAMAATNINGLAFVFGACRPFS